MKRITAVILTLALLASLCCAYAADDTPAFSKMAEAVVEELGKMRGETAQLSDEQLYEKLDAVVEKLGIELSEDSREKLAEICRTIEDLDETELAEKLEQTKLRVHELLEENDAAGLLTEFFKGIFGIVRDFFSAILGWLGIA